MGTITAQRWPQKLGYTAIYLHYNTGLHISENGRAFADRIEALLQSWPMPVEELVIVAHSMGGLVTRSACHYGALADHAWLRQLRKLVFLGTPHHGSPVERVGNWLNGMLGVSPYTAAFARMGRLRSAGITDLRYGNLLSEDWVGQIASRTAATGADRCSCPTMCSATALGPRLGKQLATCATSCLAMAWCPCVARLASITSPAWPCKFENSGLVTI